MSSVGGAGATPQPDASKFRSTSGGPSEGSRRFGEVLGDRRPSESQQSAGADDAKRADDRSRADEKRDDKKVDKEERKDDKRTEKREGKKTDGPKDGQQKVGKKGGRGGDAGDLGEGEGGLEEEISELADKLLYGQEVPPSAVLRTEGAPQVEAPKTKSLDKIFPPEAIDKVVKAVRVGMNEQGLKEIQVDLKAEALDGLKLKISQGKDGVQVQMIAETPEARDMFQLRVQDLEKVLQAKGIQVQELTVKTVSEVQAQTNQFTGDRQRQQQQQQNKGEREGVGGIGSLGKKRGAAAAPPLPELSLDMGAPKAGKKGLKGLKGKDKGKIKDYTI
jgi:hypothetical protein